MFIPVDGRRISFRQGRAVNAWFWGCSLLVHSLLLFWLSTVEITRVVAREPSAPLLVTLLPAVPPPRALAPAIVPQPTIRRAPPVIAKAQRKPLKKPHAQTKPRTPRPPSGPVARMPKTRPTAPPLPAPTPAPEPAPVLLTESEDSLTFNTTVPASSSRTDSLSSPASVTETPSTTAGGGNENEEHDEAPLPVSQVAEPPTLVSQVLPTYPPQARRWGVEGLVRLEAILTREGYVEEQVKILESVPLLDDAASAAVRQWRFTPARDHRGRRVRVILEVPLQFVLN